MHLDSAVQSASYRIKKDLSAILPLLSTKLIQMSIKIQKKKKIIKNYLKV